MGTRARLSFVGLILGVLIAALGPGGSARAAEIGTTPAEKCNPTGRTICLTVTTFENITASDATRSDGKRFTWVQWTLRNGSGTTLTHPTVIVSLADLCGTGQQQGFCTNPPSTTAQFELPAVTVAQDGTETPTNACSVSGGNLVCTYPNLAAGAPAAVTKAYFKTADLPATASVISVTGAVKERSNDGNPCNLGDPNCDTFTVPITNSYEPDLNAAFTFALPGKRFNLPANDLLSSFTFTSANAKNFLTTFKVLAPSTDFCFDVENVKCFDRTLFASTQSATGFSGTNPVVFYARLLDPPVGVTKKSLDAIHFYDAVQLTAAGNRLTPTSGPSFARMDGLRLTAPAFGQPAGKYFVVGFQAATSSTPESFQLSLTKGGAPLSLTPGSGSGEPIRIIGDQDDERTTSSAACSTNPPPSPIPFNIPVICVQDVKVGKTQALDSWVWDLGNGFVQH
jgi:hypothetical protein